MSEDGRAHGNPQPGPGGAVRQGVKWLGISMGLSRILRVLTMAVLARFLALEDFGLAALASATVLAISSFREIGFSQALIHHTPRDDEEQRETVHTAFWVQFTINVLLFLLSFFGATWIANLLEGSMDGVVPVLRAVALLFLIEGFALVPAALLQKKLQFRIVSIIEMWSTLTFSLTSIVLAVLGFGVWSLVIGNLSARLLQTLCLVRASGWHPALSFKWQSARQLFDYGKWLWGTGALNAISRSADKILLGRLGGGAVLGSYSLAFNLCNAPAKPVLNITGRVMFPALSRIKDDRGRVAESMLRVCTMITFIALPATAGLVLVAHEFIDTIYTSKFSEMVPVVRILCFYALAHCVGTIARPVLLALGKPSVVMWVTLGRQLLMLLLLLAVTLGGPGETPVDQLVAFAVLAPALGAVVVGLYLAARACGLSIGRLAGGQLMTLCSTLVMSAAVWGLGHVLDGWSSVTLLLARVAVGVLVYVVVSLALNRTMITDLGRELARLWSAGSASGEAATPEKADQGSSGTFQ